MKMTLKVGFVGTGATGKTTTVELLGDLSLKYVKSIPRGVFKEAGLREVDQEKLTPEQRWAIQRKMFDQKVQQDLEHEHGLFDRTLIDHLAYCYYRAASAIPDLVAKTLEQTVWENMRRYDVVFYFPIASFDAADDGLRQRGLAIRSAVDAIMRGLLENFYVRYVTVLPGTPQQRADQVFREIMRVWEEKQFTS